MKQKYSVGDTIHIPIMPSSFGRRKTISDMEWILDVLSERITSVHLMKDDIIQYKTSSGSWKEEDIFKTKSEAVTALATTLAREMNLITEGRSLKDKPKKSRS
jgi:hypothetical protein